MSILDINRELLMRKKDIFHFDICLEIKKGETQNKISEKFDISPRQVRKIKRLKCPDCGILPGYRELRNR